MTHPSAAAVNVPVFLQALGPAARVRPAALTLAQAVGPAGAPFRLRALAGLLSTWAAQEADPHATLLAAGVARALEVRQLPLVGLTPEEQCRAAAAAECAWQACVEAAQEQGLTAAQVTAAGGQGAALAGELERLLAGHAAA